MGFFGTSINNLVVTRNFAFDPAATRPFANAVTADGQLIIGATASPNLRVGTLTAGAGITITNGPGSITITSGSTVPTTFTTNSGNAIPSGNILNVLGGTGITTSGAGNTLTVSLTSGGLTWVDATSATQALLAQHGYVTDRGAGVTYTLPASGTLGDEILIVGKLGLATITPNANQQILIGSSSGTSGVTGTAVATNVGDCITLICITAGASTVWRANSLIGNWTLT